MKKVLVIEDDPISALIYRRFLQAHGFMVEIATDGAKGLQQFQNCPPDAVLLDLMLPRVSGVEVIQAIRAQTAHRHLPILVLTAAYVPSLVDKARAAGADRVFDKSNDKPVAVTGYLHDLFQTTANNSVVMLSKSGNPDAILDYWPAKSSQ